MQRRLAKVMLFGMLSMLFVAFLAIPAAAQITKGNCRGSATFPEKATDKILDAARAKDSVFEMPLSSTVTYTGDLGPGAQPSDEEVSFKGGVSLSIPRMSIPIASWEGDTKEVSDTGTYTYDLPDFVPQGTGGLELTAWHNHTGHPDCEAVLTVSITGDPGGVAYAAGGLTVIAGVGTMAAGRRKV